MIHLFILGPPVLGPRAIDFGCGSHSFTLGPPVLGPPALEPRAADFWCGFPLIHSQGHGQPILGVGSHAFILGPPVLGPPATDFGFDHPLIHSGATSSRASSSRATSHRFWVWVNPSKS